MDMNLKSLSLTYDSHPARIMEFKGLRIEFYADHYPDGNAIKQQLNH